MRKVLSKSSGELGNSSVVDLVKNVTESYGENSHIYVRFKGTRVIKVVTTNQISDIHRVTGPSEASLTRKKRKEDDYKYGRIGKLCALIAESIMRALKT